jgi:hypothetical protein
MKYSSQSQFGTDAARNQTTSKCTLARTLQFVPGLDDPRHEQHRQYFVDHTETGLVTGTVTSIQFTIAASPRQVWSHFKDFNCWQNCRRHYYSGAAGDLEGQALRLTIGESLDDPHGVSGHYNVTRVIPEHLLVITQIPAADGPVAGMGGIMVFLLTESATGTSVTIMMQHEKAAHTSDVDEELAYWKASAPENLLKWSDFFIPALRNLACAAHQATYTT